MNIPSMRWCQWKKRKYKTEKLPLSQFLKIWVPATPIAMSWCGCKILGSKKNDHVLTLQKWFFKLRNFVQITKLCLTILSWRTNISIHCKLTHFITIRHFQIIQNYEHVSFQGLLLQICNQNFQFRSFIISAIMDSVIDTQFVITDPEIPIPMLVSDLKSPCCHKIG